MAGATIATLLTGVFEAQAVHPTPDLDVYALADGSRVGVYFVAPGQALTPEQHERAGTWLELVVPDVATTQAALVAQGFDPLDYADREHAYFRLPGGQIYRLAAG